MAGNRIDIVRDIGRAIPDPATSDPKPLGNTAEIGTSNEFARSDHIHQASTVNLIDYDEGAFSVSLGTSSGNITVSTTSNSAYYVKIGKLVHVQGQIAVSSVSSPSGVLRIVGLPYVVSSKAEGQGFAAISIWLDNAAKILNSVMGKTEPGHNRIIIYEWTGSDTINMADAINSASLICFGGTYLTD